MREALRLAALAARALAARATDDPLRDVDWLPPQLAFLRCDARVKLLRAGNQAVGKSWVGVAECIMLCLGIHPAWPLRRVQEVWVLCASWSQSVAIQGKLWALVPKGALHPDQRYDPVRGFGGHSPALRFANGAIVRIKTTQQGALNLAGATIDHALFDEPPATQRVYAEVAKRVQARGGTISLTLTPINAPVDWLKAQAEAGHIRDLHFRLTPDVLIHTRSGLPRRLPDGTVCDAAWIARVEAESLPSEVPVVVHGEWEGREEGRIFATFSPTEHVGEEMPVGTVWLTLGIDHGTATGKQCAELAAVDRAPKRVALDEEHPVVWAVDEYRPEGATTTEQDAAGILAMLARAGVQWGQLDYVFGDKAVGSATDPARKENELLEMAIAAALGIDVAKLRPRIGHVKRGKDAGNGHAQASIRWLYRHFLRKGGVRVHRRCKALVEGLQRWEGKRDDPRKDPTDALRYALTPWIRANPEIGGAEIKMW